VSAAICNFVLTIYSRSSADSVYSSSGRTSVVKKKAEHTPGSCSQRDALMCLIVRASGSLTTDP
jgi:hypothetical protein